MSVQKQQQQQQQQTIINTSRVLQQSEETPLIQNNGKIKVYPQRWLALTVFGLHEMTNNMMWIMFSPITTIASCYYDVSLFWINSLSWIFMLTYILLLLPATWFLERFGLRATAIVGGCLNTIGGWVRFAGSSKYYYNYMYNDNILIITTHKRKRRGCAFGLYTHQN